MAAELELHKLVSISLLLVKSTISGAIEGLNKAYNAFWLA